MSKLFICHFCHQHSLSKALRVATAESVSGAPETHPSQSTQFRAEAAPLTVFPDTTARATPADTVTPSAVAECDTSMSLPRTTTRSLSVATIPCPKPRMLLPEICREKRLASASGRQQRR